MEKIISLFQRNYETDRLVRNELVPGAEWVTTGEGIATEKIDGTACMIRAGLLYKRYDAKRGKKPPIGFEPAQDTPDEVTGHWPGWVPVGQEPESKWHRQGFANSPHCDNGTYELIGPKVQGNKYRLDKHVLRLHGDVILNYVPVTFEGIRGYLAAHPQFEGIVWHHPNGRMVKIKRRDYGLTW